MENTAPHVAAWGRPASSILSARYDRYHVGVFIMEQFKLSVAYLHA